MRIALTADNAKKELLVQFCTAYAGLLSKHSFIATGTTGNIVSKATGLPVDCLLPGRDGGFDQLINRILYDEVDMLLCFRDLEVTTAWHESDIQKMMRACDTKNVPMATSLATAELLVLGLARGDLDWRQVIEPAVRDSIA